MRPGGRHNRGRIVGHAADRGHPGWGRGRGACMMKLHSLKLIDYHTHTGVTVDAKMTESDACAQAVARGILELAFTNHIMLNQPAYLMSLQACLAHWERIQACQKQ